MNSPLVLVVTIDAGPGTEQAVALQQTVEEKMAKAAFLTLDKIEP